MKGSLCPFYVICVRVWMCFRTCPFRGNVTGSFYLHVLTKWVRHDKLMMVWLTHLGSCMARYFYLSNTCKKASCGISSEWKNRVSDSEYKSFEYYSRLVPYRFINIYTPTHLIIWMCVMNDLLVSLGYYASILT